MIILGLFNDPCFSYCRGHSRSSSGRPAPQLQNQDFPDVPKILEHQSRRWSEKVVNFSFLILMNCIS